MTIRIRKRKDNKEKWNGICGKRQNLCFGRKQAIVTKNGTTLSQILNNNLINSQ